MVPVAICAAFVDFFNVVMGPLGKLVQNHLDTVSKATVHMPTMLPGIPPGHDGSRRRSLPGDLLRGTVEI